MTKTQKEKCPGLSDMEILMTSTVGDRCGYVEISSKLNTWSLYSVTIQPQIER